MERNRYLNLVRRQSVRGDALVVYGKNEYIPIEYKMKFDRQGNTMNVAVLMDMNNHSIVECLVENLEEVSDE